MQQADLWVKVWKKTGKPKRRWNMAKLFADARCSEATPASPRKTEVGLKRRVDGVGWVGGSISYCWIAGQISSTGTAGNERHFT